MRYVSSEFTLGSPASWTCPEILQRKVPRRHPYQMPKSPHSFFCHQGKAALLWAPTRCSSSSLWNSFQLPASTVSLFWSLPRAYDHRWGLRGRFTGKSCSVLSSPWWSSTHYCWCCFKPPVNFSLHFQSLINKNPRYFNFFAWTTALLQLEEVIHCFPAENHGLRLLSLSSGPLHTWQQTVHAGGQRPVKSTKSSHL